MGAPVKYEIGTVSATTTLTQLHGYSVRESAGSPAAAAVNLRKTNGSGDIVVKIELAANESDTVAFDTPIDFGGRVHVEVVAGAVEWSAFGR